MKQCYTWSNHGNLGDDWIAAVAAQYLNRSVAVRERRGLDLKSFGRHRLVREDGAPLAGDLLLWGGGWAASDRPGSRTMTKWSRYLTRQQNRVAAVGMGLGPFVDTTLQERRHIDSFFRSLGDRVGVRTHADLRHLPSGYSAVVGCDLALLDKRFMDSSRSGADSDYVVFSFPAFSGHWARMRPWMTEKWYLSQVSALAARVGRQKRIVFVEFDQVRGMTSDSSYWSRWGGVIERPSTIDEAAKIFRNARQVYAGRLHAAILGAVVGSPTLAMAYHHKFEVVAELGVPTIGLSAEPGSVPWPEQADQAVLNSVRKRGLDMLAAVGAV